MATTVQPRRTPSARTGRWPPERPRQLRVGQVPEMSVQLFVDLGHCVEIFGAESIGAGRRSPVSAWRRQAAIPRLQHVAAILV